MTLLPKLSLSCSMCKITSNGKTIVGNNEDTWRVGSRIWFEKAVNGNYGSAYVGLPNGFPQGGMNEAGLAFDGFTVYPRILKPVPGKAAITSPAKFLKELMQTCSTVEEVAAFAKKYDRSVFNHSMLLFVDKLGKYLVMEVDTLIMGSNSTYILSNFCPSQTRPEDVKIGRYLKGKAFVNRYVPVADLEYTARLMDTMHECRNKIGDGTSYTTIYDLTTGVVDLYFFHDFKQKVSLNIRAELSRPDHTYEMLSLFSANDEYERFLLYKTPFNNRSIRVAMASATLFLVLSAVFWGLVFLLNLFRQRTVRSAMRYYYLLFVFINLVIAYFIQLLLKNEPAFYFDSPYQFGSSIWINAMAYVPLALLTGIIPLVFFLFKRMRTRTPPMFFVVLLTINVLVYTAFLAATAYWHMINIF
jgi:hypothetical protein